MDISHLPVINICENSVWCDLKSFPLGSKTPNTSHIILQSQNSQLPRKSIPIAARGFHFPYNSSHPIPHFPSPAIESPRSPLFPTVSHLYLNPNFFRKITFQFSLQCPRSSMFRRWSSPQAAIPDPPLWRNAAFPPPRSSRRALQILASRSCPATWAPRPLRRRFQPPSSAATPSASAPTSTTSRRFSKSLVSIPSKSGTRRYRS